MNYSGFVRTAALASTLVSLSNAAVVLTFEGVGNLAPVGSFYNGGGGGSLGIAFGADALALVDSDAGGSGNIANEPSGETGLFFLSGPAAVMNVAAGFDTGFSFYYSAALAGSVVVYDGLDGTGNVLATIPLSVQNADNCTGDPNGSYCNWTPVGVTFSGTARSVAFGGTANFIVFDDITLGSSTPGGVIPEPSATVLLGAGLAAAVVARLRRS